MTVLLAAAAALAAAQELPGAQPTPRAGNWIKRHEAFVEEAKKGNIDVLFLGDSITDAWRQPPARALWDEHFAPLRAANFGISGDCTQHLLWRLQNGALDGIAPKVAVVLIGTNNIGNEKQSTESVVAGVGAVVREIRARSAATKILLLGIFPRDEAADSPRRLQIRDVNARLAGLDDGGKTLRFLDLGTRFLGPDGTLSRDVMPDSLHLSEQGYRIWAQALKGPLAELLGGN